MGKQGGTYYLNNIFSHLINTENNKLMIQAPQPIDKSVTIQEKPSMIFYASTFNGQMLSHQDWENKYNDLEGILSADDTATANPDIWYHIGYDSPFTPAERRRNEIWIPKGQVDETNVVSA